MEEGGGEGREGERACSKPQNKSQIINNKNDTKTKTYVISMDIWYLLEASLLTQVMKDPTLFYNPIIWILISIYSIYKLTPRPVVNIIEQYIQEFLTDDYYNTNIIVPYHMKLYTGYGAVKPIVKTLYSERFFAITHHVKKYHINKISSLTEILNFENTKYIDLNTSDFLLIPKNKQSILLCKENNIYLEVIYDISETDKDDKNNSESNAKYSIKKYVYKMFIPGLNHMEKINNFLSKIEEEYVNDNNTERQMIFEFQKTVMDEWNKLTIEFNEAPFHTNKSFDNIFFENKKEVISYLEPFLDSKHDKHEINEKYGTPFKCVFMLHGPPGCGKSSLIKSTIKYTKRHCVLVSWSKIKTCNDFVALFRPMKIDKKVYYQHELIIVFEDFDANENNILKKRDAMKSNVLKEIKKTDYVNVDHVDMNEKLESLLKVQFAKNTDEITLEYVLNVLDGIVELNNSIVFFTTNTLETMDPALTRPGRIDKVIKMDYVNSTMLEEILTHYYKKQSYSKYKAKIKNITNRKISYSRIIQIAVECKTIDDFFKVLT